MVYGKRVITVTSTFTRVEFFWLFLQFLALQVIACSWNIRYVFSPSAHPTIAIIRPFHHIGWCSDNFVMMSLTVQELSCYSSAPFRLIPIRLMWTKLLSWRNSNPCPNRNPNPNPWIRRNGKTPMLHTHKPYWKLPPSIARSIKLFQCAVFEMVCEMIVSSRTSDPSFGH